ncbi:MAG: hypothetical protein ACLTY9_08370 [Oscillospiraceae bacterium]
MKRNRKTVFALLLALAMVLCLAAAAWATEGGGTAGGDGIVVGPVGPGNYPTLTELEIPFTKTVKLGGNTGPGKTEFKLEIFDIGNGSADGYKDVTYTAAVTTNGAGSYNGELVISGPAAQIRDFVSEGFYVREVNDNLSGWTYSDAVWHINANGEIRPAKLETTANGEFYVVANTADTVREMTFENTYTYNTSYTIPDEQPISSPKTFDAGVALYGVSALLSLTGTALVIKRKKG